MSKTLRDQIRYCRWTPPGNFFGGSNFGSRDTEDFRINLEEKRLDKPIRELSRTVLFLDGDLVDYFLKITLYHIPKIMHFS